ncbi:membrane protein YczE [Streptomyces sp. NPDC003860]
MSLPARPGRPGTPPPPDRPVLLRMTASAQVRAGRKARRIPQLLVGLMGYGAAVMVLVQSGLGAAGWNVLTEGTARTLGISFGWATNLISVLVLLAWIPLRELPGVGTLLNVAVVGFAADATAAVLPAPQGTPAQLGYLLLGLVALAFFDALYLGAQFGSGPRDGIMTGLVRLTRLPVAAVRTGIEVSVAGAGWLLGGTVGFGTVLVVLGTGPLVGFFLPRVTVRLPACGPGPLRDRRTASA